MWSSGKGFAKVGALYAGVECCIEGVSCHRRNMGSANESTGRNTI
jgi:hypothetical protein